MFNKKLKQALKDQDVEIIRLNKEVSSLKHLEQTNNEILEINHKLVDKLNKSEKQNREQTEADICFSCDKIKKDLLDGKDKKEISPELSFRTMAMERLAQQQRSGLHQYYNSGLSGILGQSGASIFR